MGNTQADEIETSTEKSYNWIKAAAWVTGVVLTVIASSVGTIGVTWFFNRQQVLTYKVEPTPAILDTSKYQGSFEKPPEIKLGDRTLNNISAATVLVYNNSGKDVADLIVSVYVNEQQAKSLSRRIIKTGPNIEEILQSPSPSTSPTAKVAGEYLRYDYRVKVANRSDDPVLQLQFLFEGAVIPDIGVEAKAIGFTLKKQDAASPFQLSFKGLVAVSLFVLAASAVLGAGAGIGFSVFNRISQNKTLSKAAAAANGSSFSGGTNTAKL